MLGSTVDTWATVGVAVGTIATVVYALFRDVFVVPRRRPRLELHLDDDGGDHARLHVENRPGKDTADDVVVIVTDLRRLGGADDVSAIGLPLMWSGTSPALTVASVHPGSRRHVDLVHAEGRGLRLALSPPPVDGKASLVPGTYEVSVEIRARNADAIRYVIPLSTDGKSLRVATPRRVR
jgi:hypothetical protein